MCTVQNISNKDASLAAVQLGSKILGSEPDSSVQRFGTMARSNFVQLVFRILRMTSHQDTGKVLFDGDIEVLIGGIENGGTWLQPRLLTST